MSGPKFRTWKRADGWIEIDGLEAAPLLGRRFRTDAEADAFLAGLQIGWQTAHSSISRALGDSMEIEDARPIRAAPGSAE